MATERERKYTKDEGGRLLIWQRVEVGKALAADLPAKQVEASAALAERLELQEQVDRLEEQLVRRGRLPALLDAALDKGVEAEVLERLLTDAARFSVPQPPPGQELEKAAAMAGDLPGQVERKLILPAEEPIGPVPAGGLEK